MVVLREIFATEDKFAKCESHCPRRNRSPFAVGPRWPALAIIAVNPLVFGETGKRISCRLAQSFLCETLKMQSSTKFFFLHLPCMLVFRRRLWVFCAPSLLNSLRLASVARPFLEALRL